MDGQAGCSRRNVNTAEKAMFIKKKGRITMKKSPKQEVIDMYCAANNEDRKLMIKVIQLFAENPKQLDSVLNWKGSADDLKTVLMNL